MKTQDGTLSSAGRRDNADPAVAARVDVGSANCATLILYVRSAMGSLDFGQVLEVIAYDPTARLDLEAWCRMTGNRYLYVTTDENFQTHFLEKKEN